MQRAEEEVEECTGGKKESAGALPLSGLATQRRYCPLSMGPSMVPKQRDSFWDEG